MLQLQSANVHCYASDQQVHVRICIARATGHHCATAQLPTVAMPLPHIAKAIGTEETEHAGSCKLNNLLVEFFSSPTESCFDDLPMAKLVAFNEQGAFWVPVS